MAKTSMIEKPGDVTSNEWEQRKSKVTLNTWDFRHAAHVNSSCSSGYGIVVEEVNDTNRARAPIEPTGGNENASCAQHDYSSGGRSRC